MISGSASRLLTGANIAPHLAVPYMASANSGPLAPMKTTRSPRPTPRARSAAAALLDPASMSAKVAVRPALESTTASGVAAERFLMISARESTGVPSAW